MSMLAGDGIPLRALLLDGGVYIAPGPRPHALLAEYILNSKPRGRARPVGRLGWAGPSYVQPHKVFGASEGERIVFQSDHPIEHMFAVAGTLADWQANTGQKCLGNSRLIVGVAAAFVGLLLEPVGAEAFGINLRGQSTIGKTSILRVAGSVWGGGGTQEFFRTWRATSNGLESVAALHSDSLLCLDEISQVEPREAGAAAYMLANGQGKQRATQYGASRRSALWRIFFLSSGEMALSTAKPSFMFCLKFSNQRCARATTRRI
jgi:uncharacterized protein (DUF927 family)